MGFSDVLKKIYPFLSVAASIGGPIGTIAAGAVGSALNLSKPPAANDLESVITNALADPAQRTALQKAEQDFQVQMAQLGYQDAEALAADANADRASARLREETLKDRMPAILAVVVNVGFFGVVGVLIWSGVKGIELSSGVRPVLFMLLGTLAREMTSVYAYFFGTSASSDSKTEIIADIAKS